MSAEFESFAAGAAQSVVSLMLAVGGVLVGVLAVRFGVRWVLSAVGSANYSGRWDARWPDGDPVESYDDEGSARYEWIGRP